MKRIQSHALLLSILIFAASNGVHAGTWIENFNTDNLDRWTRREHQRERVTWQAQGGHLDVQIQPFCNEVLELPLNYTLEFTVFPIQVELLRVKITILSAHNAHLGLFIGRQPRSVFVSPMLRAYQFMDHLILGPVEFEFRGEHRQVELNLKEIEVKFERGQFQLLSKGKQIVNFRNNAFELIDLVGIVVFPKNCHARANAVMDNFLISGPNLAVNAKGKLATTWGDVKNGKRKF